MKRQFTAAIKPANETWISREFQTNPLLTWRWALYDIAVIGTMVVAAVFRLS